MNEQGSGLFAATLSAKVRACKQYHKTTRFNTKEIQAPGPNAEDTVQKSRDSSMPIVL